MAHHWTTVIITCKVEIECYKDPSVVTPPFMFIREIMPLTAILQLDLYAPN
jgi:hypothetical protein